MPNFILIDHYLLSKIKITHDYIMSRLDHGNNSEKPGIPYVVLAVAKKCTNILSFFHLLCYKLKSSLIFPFAHAN
jgi:hypothetical protein